MPTDLKNLLVEFGFSSAEIDVYLSAVRLGESTAAEIAHQAKLPRTTAASILKRLEQEGLVSLHKQKNKFLYWIESPAVLVENQKTKLALTELLQSRLNLEYRREDKKPTVEIFETKKSILHLINKVLEECRKGSEILTWDSPLTQNYLKVMPEDLFKVLSNRKVTKGIQTRSLIPNGQQQLVNKNISPAIKVRILPPGLVFDTSIWIYNNSIVLFSGTHTFAVRITNRHMQESIRSLFNFLWSLSAPFN